MKQAFCWIQSHTGFHENTDMAANELLTLHITILLVLYTDLKLSISLFISKNGKNPGRLTLKTNFLKLKPIKTW